MKRLAPFLLVCLAACQDPHAKTRAELAATQAKVARKALEEGKPARAQYAAELAALYDPLDPSHRDLAIRAWASQVAATRQQLSLEQLGRLAYQAEALAARDPANAHVYATVVAMGAFARGDSKTAEKKLVDVVGARADYLPAWQLLGEVLLAGGRQAEALKAFSEADKLDKANARTLANLGILYAQRGEFVLAIDALTRALNLDDTATLRGTLANALIALDRPVEAIPHLVRATSLEPKEGRYRVSLGEAHLKLEQLDEAARAFRDAAVLGAEPLATRGLGAVALKRKDWATAVQAFKRVLAVAPDEVSTLYFAAEASENLKDTAQAATWYARFIELADKRPNEAARVLLAKDRLARLQPTH